MEKFRDLELLSVLGCRVQADSLQLDEHPKLKVFATDQLCVNVSTDNSSFTVNANIDTGVDAQVVCQMLLDVTIPVKTIACSGNRRPYFSCYVDHVILLAIAHKHGAALERWINFHCAMDMDNAALEQFLMMCPRMKTLDIPRSQHLTCAAVFCVAEHCRNLVALIMDIADVTDEAVHVLLTRCTKLKKLCMPGELLTPAAFESCSQLTMLGFTSQQLRFTVSEMINVATGGQLGKLRVLRLPHSNLLQYVSIALISSGSKLKVEPHTNIQDFM